MAKLSPKQKMFVSEYLIDLNATKAAERAGYSAKGATVQGSRLLANVNIATAIAEQQGKRLQKLEITADRVLNELALLGFANMMDYITVSATGEARVDLSKLTREQAAAIGEITVEEYTERTGEGEDAFEKIKRTKFKLTDKRGALVDLGRHLKLFTDKVEHSGKVSVRDMSDEELAELAASYDESAASGASS